MWVRRALVVAALVAAGCGGSGGSAGDDDPSSAASSSSTGTTVDDAEGLGAVEEVLPSLLVTAGDLGLTDVGFTPGDETCGPSVATVGARLTSASASVTEALHAYRSVDDAADGYEACAPDGGSDVAERVGAEEARRDGDVVVARVADVVMVVEVTGADLLDVAAVGAGKITGYLETPPASG
jgi:hypothetical protein